MKWHNECARRPECADVIVALRYIRGLTWQRFGDAEILRCDYCGGYRPFERASGPSRDDRDVAIEIRAAELAANVVDANLGIALGLINHDMTIEELVGWMRCGDNRERGTYPKSAAWQAGWLAATIYSHHMYDRRDHQAHWREER